MEIMACPETGRPMSRGVRSMTIRHKGLTVTFDMPGWYAEGVEDGIHDGEDMKVSTRHLNALKARAEGLMTPAEVRRIRRKLKLNQRKAGLVIGGGINAFQKYEAGDILVSRGIDSALRLLDADPSKIAVLDRPKAAGEVVA